MIKNAATGDSMEVVDCMQYGPNPLSAKEQVIPCSTLGSQRPMTDAAETFSSLVEDIKGRPPVSSLLT